MELLWIINTSNTRFRFSLILVLWECLGSRCLWLDVENDWDASGSKCDKCVDHSKMAGSHAQQSAYLESLYCYPHHLSHISH